MSILNTIERMEVAMRRGFRLDVTEEEGGLIRRSLWNRETGEYADTETNGQDTWDDLMNALLIPRSTDEG